MRKISSAVPSSNESEKFVENFLNQKLSNDFECYIQPNIGDENRADFVILNAKTRICVVIEVKQRNLHNCSLDEQKRIYLAAKSQIKASQINLMADFAKIDRNKIIPCLLFYRATTEFARSICDENDDFKDSVFGKDEEFEKFINNLSKPQQNRILNQVEFSRLKEILTTHKKEFGVKINFTKEQEKYIKPRAKTWQRVRGVAGSGKTLIVCERAARLASLNKKVLIICHNRTLKNHLKWHLENSYNNYTKDNIKIFYFDNFLRSFLKENGVKENEISKENYEKSFNFLILKTKEFLDNGINIQGRKYDAILIDEAQDLQQECFEILIKFLTKNDEVLVVADERQNLRDRDLSWLDNKAYKFDSKWGNLEKQNLRQHKFPGIILKANEFSREFFKDDIFSENEIKEQKERLDFARLLWCDYTLSFINEDYYIWAEEIFSAYIFLRYSGFENKDITILVATKEDGKGVVKYFEEQKFDEQKIDIIHTLDSYAKDEFSLSADAVKVSTVDSFKGLESKAVIFINRPRKEKDEKLFFVALTRATEFFIVFNCVEGHKKFGKSWENFYKNLEKFMKTNNIN